MAARPTFIPERTASQREISGRFFTTSLTADVISTARSITAPEEPMKIAAIKIWVRLRS